ncbi:zf-HC2 domain-containing protein [Amycolatopsis thermalba]|uniref:Zf-HC2 domain-containing protein n=1 Tax=Amycolatopsis thermalba TaxID=944492 RepID=A0ABY4NRH4_9PSEU|nr:MULTISPECIES: zf-HC2 domain-containing protein [Amycolatopsis]UQS22660.1 zf-HC2 domain-containing protein [Amycolatopsis thermalba]
MSELRGWGLPESHLLPDAVVAFVDGEMSLGARERAASHVARCPICAAEVTSQRQVRAAVRHAGAPSMPASLLASLRNIPQDTDLPTSPDNLAVTEDGQLVAIQRPDRVAGLKSSPFGSSAPLGSSAPFGSGSAVLGGQRQPSVRRRVAQGAGVAVSGLVLSALALVVTSSTGGDPTQANPEPGQAPAPGVLRAQLGGEPSAPATTTTTTTPAPVAGR